MTKLLWAFFSKEGESDRFITYINLNRLSIKRALDLGYHCTIITNKDLFKYFLDLDVSLDSFNEHYTPFFDYTKHYALKNYTKDYIIIDGDLMLKDLLPEVKADLVFEKYEVNNWKSMYKKYVDFCSLNDIKQIIPEWTGNKRHQIFNIGLLNIQNDELREIYLDRWYKFRTFIDSFNLNDRLMYAITGSQYLLTELVEYHKFTSKDYRTSTEQSTYLHYLGERKFTSNIVPSDKLLTFNSSLL